MLQLRLILGLGLQKELRQTLERMALLGSILGRNETIPKAGPVPGFTDQALGCALTRPRLDRCMVPPAAELAHVVGY